MSIENFLTPEELREFLSYSPETGELFWKPRRAEMCPKVNGAYLKKWNARYAGQPALCTFRAEKGGRCYYGGSLFGFFTRAHRAAWAIHHGEWPSMVIDHINGDGLDNRICNLRNVTVSQNGQNQKVNAKNTSGYRGVSWKRGRGSYSACIIMHGRYKFLGYYPTAQEAHEARVLAEKQMGFG